MVDAKVAVLADTLGIQGSVGMFAFSCFLCSTFCMVAILTHAVSIVWLVVMTTFWNLVSVLLFLDILRLGHSVLTVRNFCFVLTMTRKFLKFRLQNYMILLVQMASYQIELIIHVILLQHMSQVVLFKVKGMLVSWVMSLVINVMFFHFIVLKQ